jgi:anti-sigma28 factor (negative regulator of flagellin synthesis)
MSMRIQNDALAAAAASQTAPAESAKQAGSSKPSGSSLHGTDQVDISSFSANVADSNATLAAQQAARVKHLAALYAAGQYHVDSAQLSRAMVSRAISGGSVEDDR